MPYENPIPEMEEEQAVIAKEDEIVDYTQIQTVYFAFIDVLGFKKTFDDIKISKNIQAAKKYKDVFNYYFALMNSAKFMEQGTNTGCYAGQTSDSLYFYTNRTDYLFQFIKIFSHFNLYSMSKDVFFRGGIAKGELYKKKDYQFYGDSVIGAYLLESTISKNPIIMIDEQTNKDIHAIAGYKDFIDIDLNKRHFIKPFEFLRGNYNLDISKDFPKREIDIKKIKKAIEYNLKVFEYDANNYSKYVFLKKELEKIDT